MNSDPCCVAGTSVTQLRAEDADGEPLIYGVVGEEAMRYFAVERDTGVVWLRQPLDREVRTRTHTLAHMGIHIHTHLHTMGHIPCPGLYAKGSLAPAYACMMISRLAGGVGALPGAPNVLGPPLHMNSVYVPFTLHMTYASNTRDLRLREHYA